MTAMVEATRTAVPPTRDVLVERAREIGELAWARKAESETNRRLPDDIVERLVDSGLMRLTRTRRWGGYETPLHTMLDVGRELGRQCGSLSWIHGVNSTHDWYLSFANEQLQHDLWADNPDAFVCDSLAPMGKVDRVADGYLLSGHWRFASGIEWASWIAVGAVLKLPDADEPEPVMLLVPKSEVSVRDEWRTLGLRGTASNDVLIDNVFVPEHRMFPWMRLAASGGAGVGSRQQNEGPYWRLHLASMLAFCFLPTALGLGQRALDEFTTWTKGRVRIYDRGSEQREAPAAQLALAESTVQWDAAWAITQRFINESTKLAETGEHASGEHRARFKAWNAFAARSCIELTDRLYTDGGAMGLFETHPMHQVFRDMHSAGAHFALGRADAYTSLGRSLLGFPSTTFL